MVFSEILLKIPYSIAWQLTNAKMYAFPVVFYCTGYLDYLVFEPVRKYLPELTIVSKNRKVQNLLNEKGISSILYPAYPKVVIMARHAHHMFPSKKIVQIGMRHGVYSFKDLIDSKKYNRFDLFLFSSEKELEKAEKAGIKSGTAAGFPKIDNLHNGSITADNIENLKASLNFDLNKKTLIFSATWNKSGLSALEQWYDKLKFLSGKYNILVTVHPFTENKYIEFIKNTPEIYFIENEDLNPYLKMSDLMIGDTSSIIGEYCSLDKPMITFVVEEQGRLSNEIIAALDKVSFRVNNFEELKNSIPVALKKPDEHKLNRQKLNRVLFSNLNGEAGKKAASLIKEFIINQGISF